jgi:hypothetical protein
MLESIWGLKKFQILVYEKLVSPVAKLIYPAKRTFAELTPNRFTIWTVQGREFPHAEILSRTKFRQSHHIISNIQILKVMTKRLSRLKIYMLV